MCVRNYQFNSARTGIPCVRHELRQCGIRRLREGPERSQQIVLFSKSDPWTIPFFCPLVANDIEHTTDWRTGARQANLRGQTVYFSELFPTVPPISRK